MVVRREGVGYQEVGGRELLPLISSRMGWEIALHCNTFAQIVYLLVKHAYLNLAERAST